jgi:glycosyltransferase involved in cell wall biosynthesis
MQGAVCLSVNAVPGVGGQGANLVNIAAGIARVSDLTLLACGPMRGVRGATFPWHETLEGLRALPIVRRLRGTTTRAGNVAFDLWSARHVPANARVVVGGSGHSLRVLRRARELGAKTVVDSVTHHIHALHTEVQRESRRFGLHDVLGSSVHSMLAEYEYVDRIRVMSAVSRETFIRAGVPAHKLCVVRPEVLIPSGPAAKKSATFKAMFVGLLEPWKGFHFAIDAFRRLEAPNATLGLVGFPGSRPVSSYLEKTVNADPRVRIERRSVQSEGWLQVYPEADVLVHPSLSDGFGFVVAEAMACGVPAIVSSATGASDLIEDGVNGFVVPPRDVSAIHERLALLESNRDLALAMGERARETIRTRLGRASFDTELASVLELPT